MARQAPKMVFLRGKVYYYQFKIKGKKYSGNTGETDRQKALAVYEDAYAKAKFQAKHATPVRVDPALTPTSEMFKLYIERKMGAGTRTGRATVRSGFDRFLDFFGDVPLATLNNFQMEDFREHLRQSQTNVAQWKTQKPLAVKTVNSMLSAIGSVYRYFALPNPLAGITRVEETKETILDRSVMFWTDKQEQALMDASRKYVFEYPMKFMLWTGCRPAELRYLHNSPQHIDAEQRVIRFIDKRKRVRGIQLIDKPELILAWDALQAWIRENKVAPGAPLFPYGENWFKRRFEVITKAAKLPDVPCHQLRHQFVKRAFYVWGWDLTTISKWAGHRTNMAYETYSNLLIQKPKSDSKKAASEIVSPRHPGIQPYHGRIDNVMEPEAETITISLEEYKRLMANQ